MTLDQLDKKINKKKKAKQKQYLAEFLDDKEQSYFWRVIYEKATQDKDMRAAIIIADRLLPKLEPISVNSDETERLKEMSETLIALAKEIMDKR